MKQRTFDIALQLLGSITIAFFTFFATGFLTLTPLELSFFQRIVLSGALFGLTFGILVGRPYAALLLLLFFGSLLFVDSYYSNIYDADRAVLWGGITACGAGFFAGLIRKHQTTLLNQWRKASK